MKKGKAAFLFACRMLGKGGRLFMWTFTFKDLLSPQDTRKNWNHLLTLLLRTWPELQGLRVFELHEQHGLHVHLITNRFIDVNRARELATQAGWGRIACKKIPIEYAAYLAKCLSRKRPECLKGWHLWAGFGKGWEWTRVKDVTFESLFSRTYHACKGWLGWTGNDDFFGRMRFVRRVVIATIENDWPDGCGPGGRPYSDFDRYDPDSEFIKAIGSAPP